MHFVTVGPILRATNLAASPVTMFGQYIAICRACLLAAKDHIINGMHKLSRVDACSGDMLTSRLIVAAERTGSLCLDAVALVSRTHLIGLI